MNSGNWAFGKLEIRQIRETGIPEYCKMDIWKINIRENGNSGNWEFGNMRIREIKNAEKRGFGKKIFG